MAQTAAFRRRVREIRGRSGVPPDERLAEASQRIITALGSIKGSGPAAQALASRLRRCTPADPCGSSVCPTCALKFQAEALAALEQTYPASSDLITASIIIGSLERPAGCLHTLQLKSIQRALRRTLERAGGGLIPLWGYLDLSWNTHAEGLYEPHWCPHFHVVTEAKYGPMLRCLREHLAEGTSVKRPLRIDPVRDWLAQTSYACKPSPTHRCDYSKVSAQARASKYPLPTFQAAEFALWLGDVGPQNRHFAFNLFRTDGEFVTRK